MTEYRETGDRTPAPDWFLRELAERAAVLLSGVDEERQTPDWRERVARWREIWATVQANRG